MAPSAAGNSQHLGRRSNAPIYLIIAGIMITVVVMTLIGRSMLASAERAEMKEYLSAGLAIAHEAVSDWVDHQSHMAAGWADSVTVSTLSRGLLEVNPTRNDLRASPLFTEMSRHLANDLPKGQYLSYAVINRDGIILISSRDSEVGTQWIDSSHPEFLERVWADGSGFVVTVPPSSLNPAGSVVFYFASVIRAPDGKAAAALILTADPEEGFADVFRRGRFGATGEIYAFDGAGRLVSESRFTDQLRAIALISSDQNPVHNVSVRDPGVDLVAGNKPAWPVGEQPLTRMASEALAGRDGSDLNGYRDYRGVEVVGAWLWDESLGLGFASEVDAAEAFSIMDNISSAIVIGAILLEVLIVVLAAFFIRDRRHQETRIAAEAEFRSITNAATDAIVSINSDGAIRSWNPAAERMFAFPLEQAIGMDLATLVPEQFRAACWDGLKRLQDGEQHRMVNPSRLTARRRDGTEFLVELSLGSWNSSEGTLHTAILRDVTERVRLERDQVAHREQLERLLDSKSRLIASVAHQLRTPLTSIIGYTDLLLNERETLTSGERARMIHTVAIESSHLAYVIEDLLVAARTDLEHIPLRLERTDLAAVAETTIDRMSALPIGRLLTISGHAEANADPRRVRQIVRNLVSNAMRHGGGLIHIEVACQGPWAALSVRDDGNEIPSSERDRIFEPYAIETEEHNTTQSIGLGLSVSRRLAELMGGSLTYRYQDGESSFDLRLPRWDAIMPE